MNEIRAQVPRLMICGVSSGVGKSLFTMGLLLALRARGKSVSCCATGSALHQSLIYSRLSGRYSRSIDPRVLDSAQVLASLREAERGADIILIDGTRGLYDGVAPGEDFGSDADIAVLTHTPVVLLSNAPLDAHRLVEMVKGFSRFSEHNYIKGIAANRVAFSPKSTSLSIDTIIGSLSEPMKQYGLPRFVAALPQASFVTELPSAECNQHENLTALPREFLLDVEKFVADHTAIDELLAIAEKATQLPLAEDSPPAPGRACRIAIAEDGCFGIGYQDNVGWLAHYGAELVPFSPLADGELPRNIGGVYIPGAYLDSYGAELARNERMRSALLAFAHRGGAVYSEGAGTAYLCRTFKSEKGGPVHSGVGLIQGDAVRVQNPRGTVAFTLADDSVLGAAGAEVRGIASGEWALRAPLEGAAGCTSTLRVSINGAAPFLEGYSPTFQSVATFQFLHFGSNPEIARSIVQAAAVTKTG